jgi:hypothetical protein
MKFSDITGNDVTTLTEAPMGFMNTIGTAVKAINPFSLSGRNKAQGQFKTGVSANQIYAQYYKWLGQTGSPADTDTVLAFLQQNGYGEQAITAAQSKFPAAPQQPTPNNASSPAGAAASTTPTQTTANPADPQGTTYDPAKAAADKAAKNQADADQRNADIEKTKQANAAAAAADNALRAKVAAANATPGVDRTLSDKNAIKAGAAKGIHESKKRRLREGQELTKDQLSAIFTAVAQSGAVPQQSTSAGSDGNSAETGTTQDSGGDDTSANGQQATDQQSRNSGRSSQMPNRLTPDDILRYYAKLDKPDERLKVKNGIPEVDKQLDKTSQQID